MSAYPSAPGDLDWRVSQRCEGGACIMVARKGDSVIFGNTQDPNGPVYAYTASEWQQFLAGAKQGDFDGV
jgi:predicted secreted Zn-dependent protease